MILENENMIIQTASEVDPVLLRMLDRGIDDVSAGRTLPHKEAMEEIKRIRDQRRQERERKTAARA